MSTRSYNLVFRFLTAGVGLPIVLGVLYGAPAWGFYALVLPVALAGTYELLSMTHPADRASRAAGVALAAAASVTLYLKARDPRALLAIMLLLPPCGPLVTLARLGNLETAALRACALGFGPLFVCVPLTLLPVLRRSFGQSGAGAVVLALGTAWFADTGAYFAGRFLGRHKLYEAVSPNKTLEGAVGGVIASVVWAVVAAASYLRGALPLRDACLVGVAAGVLGQAGDLGESLLKRSTGVKDSGILLPGHGGVLDRVDALLVTSVVVYLYTQWRWAPIP